MAVILQDVSQDRNNNLNLIRFLAAVLVLFSHCYPLSGTSPEILSVYLKGLTGGHVAVDVFFVISGFCVVQFGQVW